MDYKYFSNLDLEISETLPDSIISRSLYQDGQVKVILFGFAPGQELSEHTASTPAILHFLSGKARLLLGKDQHEAAAGTWVYMPANLPHSIQAETRLTVLLELLVSP